MRLWMQTIKLVCAQSTVLIPSGLPPHKLGARLITLHVHDGRVVGGKIIIGGQFDGNVVLKPRNGI